MRHLRELVDVVCAYTNCDIEEFYRGQARTKPKRLARILVVGYAKDACDMSFPEAGRLIGKKNHSAAFDYYYKHWCYQLSPAERLDVCYAIKLLILRHLERYKVSEDRPVGPDTILNEYGRQLVKARKQQRGKVQDAQAGWVDRLRTEQPPPTVLPDERASHLDAACAKVRAGGGSDG